MGPQDDAVFRRVKEKRVLHAAGRVVPLEVQAVEVEPLRLGLRSLGDLIPHRHERVRDQLGDAGDRVPGTDRPAAAGQRHVHCFFSQYVGLALGSQLRTAAVVRGLDGLPGHIHSLAGIFLGLRRQCADLSTGQRHRRSVAEMRGAQGRQLVKVRGGRKGLLGRLGGRGQGVRAERGDLFGIVGIVGT